MRSELCGSFKTTSLRIPCLSNHARHVPMTCKILTKALEQAKPNSNV